jgi:hypothetical protein
MSALTSAHSDADTHPQIAALGYCSSPFNPTRPGRLCRGREAWVAAWEEDVEPLWRLVISGALFSDDSARDARRGLNWSGVDIGVLVKALFPSAWLLVFKEEGDLLTVPQYVEDEDIYLSPAAGGRGTQPLQRWRALVDDVDELARLVENDRIDGALVFPTWQPPGPELLEDLFLLVGHGNNSRWPMTRFQPLALSYLLRHVPGVICVHQDKHGPALGVYTRQPLDRAAVLEALAESAGSLAVPFSIPPMLARWDRALHEFRVQWVQNREAPFPVPPAPEGYSPWSASSPRYKAWRRREGDGEEE